jgi:predicted secreted protein
MSQTKGMGTTFKIMSDTPVTVGELKSISPPSRSADTIDTTTLSNDDGYRTFIQGLKDGGEVSLSGFYDPTEGNGQAELEDLFDSGDVETFNIVYPDGIGQTLEFDGILTAVAPAVEMEDSITFECTIKVSGKPTMAATV